MTLLASAISADSPTSMWFPSGATLPDTADSNATTISGASSTTGPSAEYPALQFSGSGKAEVATPHQTITGPYSIGLYFKPSSLEEECEVLFTGEHRLKLSLVAFEGLVLSVGTGSAWLTENLLVVPSNNEWELIVITVSATGVYCYQNGKPVKGAIWSSATPALWSTAAAIKICEGYAGKLAALAAIPSTLASHRVADYQEAAKGESGHVPSGTATSAYVAKALSIGSASAINHWELNETGGTLIRDYAGHNTGVPENHSRSTGNPAYGHGMSAYVLGEPSLCKDGATGRSMKFTGNGVGGAGRPGR